MDRRKLLALGAAGFVGAAAAPGFGWTQELSPLPNPPAPIGREERAARIAKAQKLMRELGFGALLVEPGSSLIYFTGVRWSRSERLTCALIPADGEVCIVTPFFEEPSVRESLGIAAQVRTWQEHEDPTALVAGWLKERKLGSAVVGIEETNRYFIVDGLKKNLPSAVLKNGAPVVRGCRMIKTAPEIALMQRASDITMAAYRHTIPKIEAGMTPRDIGAIMNRATAALGGEPEFALVLLGEASAYPHGSGKPQVVKPGEVVLMDCGCTFRGYQSDISRTFVFGEATVRQRKVWNEVKRGQEIAFEAARLGVSAGSVDDAARNYYVGLGYGPDYKLPGLSHRTGHGIGMDGHEPVNLVRGETTKLAPGMCFSDEPGIYIPGEFGVRLEDCFHMTEQGPKWFSQPSASLEKPV
ncbi:MAG: aminopeptidase P family protein [Phenylobacterium sp.]|uniref:M24 family metallopeptidase n=1 Tax=Phenylobacterium sp. TaxID=1871053 RepID=UPI00122ABE03|nr:Xaa-Pro peptidase family protein [Phenylobacterium sp.]TAL37342.1 MAG: aminopeptidase P family protein [Phenylobacterium sp.]